MPYKKVSGIYYILNKISNKYYIGSSLNVMKRLHQHEILLSKNIHFNTHLQFSFNKYGKHNFEFSIIESCDAKNLIEKENFWIAQYKSNNREFGYNVRLETTTNRGIKHSVSTREKLRISHLGKKRSQELNEKIAKTQFKSVCQIDSFGNKLNEFSSLLEAEKITGVYRQAISGVCRKLNKSAGGYYWCFSKDFINFVLPKYLRDKK